ncbi:hypothetical protein COV20_05880 [Candidatus Woesearchaeota archaeon CG10_big_fil_rev_8_21_14_0_10_45_16]|nr:MAG: hypothetical protein COV20_05880 [Candidatus Woesearchaeota archaeon CG10_big_fil_rev_8_21_14_0_10_45_16]
MGCCGHDFISKEKTKEAIDKNTEEFALIPEKDERSLLTFRDRAYTSDLRDGVCRNLIKKDGCFLCPLHPALNKKDLRIGHCDVNFLCDTAKKFADWDEKKQQRFTFFIESRKLDNISYSMQMSSGSLLAEFTR